MDEEITDVQQQSKINSGSLINIRLHNMWEDCYKFKSKDSFYSWNKTLDSIWCELGGDEKEDSDNSKKYDAFNEKLLKILPSEEFLHTVGGNFGHNNPNLNILKIKSKIYNLLISKELFLRRLQNKQGKGTAYQDGSDDYMDK